MDMNDYLGDRILDRLRGQDMVELNYYNEELQGSDASINDSPDEDLLASEEQTHTYNPF